MLTNKIQLREVIVIINVELLLSNSPYQPFLYDLILSRAKTKTCSVQTDNPVPTNSYWKSEKKLFAFPTKIKSKKINNKNNNNKSIDIFMKKRIVQIFN